MKYLLVGLLVALVIVSGCAQKIRRQNAIKQGICGLVVIKRGNHMPSPDTPTPPGEPAQRDILIFPLLNQSQVDAGENGFIQSVRAAKPIKTIKSGQDGRFCVSLPVGRYSIIIQEHKGLYANLFDTQNNIAPINIQKNRQSYINIEVTHQAVF